MLGIGSGVIFSQGATRLLRKQTSMPLEWIAKELTMGVRSSVSRADHNLTNELKENKKLQKIWRKIQ
jgi:hypothetical protein